MDGSVEAAVGKGTKSIKSTTGTKSIKGNNMKEYLKNRQKGFSLVEVILAAALFVIFTTGAVKGLVQSYNANRLGAEYTVATQFASEGIEAVRSVKNRDFTLLQDTAPEGCGLEGVKVQGKDVWAFQAICSNNTLTHNTQDNYIRTIKVESIYRDGVPPAGNIVDQSTPGSVIDLNAKKITSTVTWNFSEARPESTSLVTYLTDWKKEISTPPTVTTVDADTITATSANLKGLADPNGGITTGWFRYDTTSPGTCNDTFGTRAPLSGGSPLGNGTTNVPFNENVTGLSPTTTYHFCAIANNSGATSFGLVENFLTLTPATPPTVTTQPESNPDPTSMTINGRVNPNGNTTFAWFRYDTVNPGTCDDNFGTKVPASGQNWGSGSTDVDYSENLSGLSPLTPYFYCAIASNAGGTSFGIIETFTTPAAPIQFVGTVSATGNNSTSGSFTLPSGWAAGDVAVFWWYTFNNNKTITPNAAITQKQLASAAGFGRIHIGYRRLQAGDTTFSWTSSSASNSTVIWGTSLFRNVFATGDPFEAQSGAPATFTNTLNPNPPAVSTLSPNAMVVPIYGKINDYTSITAPSTYTTAGSNSATVGNDASAGVAYKIRPAAGSEDPGNWTLGGGASGDDGYVWTGALKPQ